MEKLYFCKKETLMTQLVITLKYPSFLPNIRRIVKSLQGVESVSVSKQKLPKSQKEGKKTKHSSATFLKGLTMPKDKSSQQLIDEYLEEKYSV